MIDYRIEVTGAGKFEHLLIILNNYLPAWLLMLLLGALSQLRIGAPNSYVEGLPNIIKRGFYTYLITFHGSGRSRFLTLGQPRWLYTDNHFPN